MDTLKIGFLGVTQLHAESYIESIRSLPALELVGVYDRDRASARRFASSLSTRLTGLDELLRAADAVIVTSETVLHLPLVKRAVEAGKPVLCEKPLATTLKDADEISRAVKRGKTLFQMCHVVRYHPAAVATKRVIESGSIGELRAIVGVNRINAGHKVMDWFHDRDQSGGGAVIDHTAHLCDTMRWYTGSEVRDVYCEIGSNVNPAIGVEDSFLTTVTFEDGVLGHMDGSWSYPRGYFTWGDFVLKIVGTEGVAVLDVFNQHLELIGMDPPNDRLEWRSYGPNANTLMIEDFAWCITRGGEVRATLEDGVEGLQVALASYESASRHAVVRLDRGRHG